MVSTAPAVDLAALSRSLDGEGRVREAEVDDAVDGVPAGAVVRATTVGAVSRVLAHCTAQGLTVVPRGAGTALDWGAPPERADVVLELAALDRVLEHAAGDLIVSVQAGVPLRVLREQLAGAGQELVVDAPRQRLDGGSTVGGALATAVSGPRRLRRLALRDLVLGATVVLADGTVAASGGKVVKNVAGYDLAKLMTGSYGTLAVVVLAAFRLHPVPAARRFVVCTGPLAEVAAAAREVVASQLAPSAVELDRPAGSDTATVAVLLEGAADAVTERAARAAALVGGEVGGEPAWWSALPGGPVLAKATATLTGVARLLEAARAAEQRHGVGVAVRGSALGVLHAGITARAPAAVAAAVTDLRRVAPAAGEGTVVVLRAPADVRAGLDAWGPVAGLDLMRAVKHRLDPGRTLAPGRFVEGI